MKEAEEKFWESIVGKVLSSHSAVCNKTCIKLLLALVLLALVEL
jgi:hypothetical protein